MLKKESKLKIVKNDNYQTEKQINNIKYPDLYGHMKYGNTNSLSKNITNNKRRISSSNSKQLSNTSTGFFKRNYNNYLAKIFSKKNFINSSMIKQSELNDLLYKLKKYNNEIMTYSYHKQESINNLKNTLKLIEFKYNKLKELQDIELPDEKISVKNFNEVKMSKADIEQQLYNLIKEKQDIDYCLKNEQEYNKTIEYMFEDEQNRLLSIKRETNIIEQKLYNVSKYQKIVTDNLKKSEAKNKNYVDLDDKINNDINLIDQVNNKQDITNKKLDDTIKEKEKKIKILEEQLNELKKNKDNDLNEYENEIKEEIEKAKEIGKKRIEDEKKYFEIINCLYIIQKYFIEEENFNKDKLLSSKDYHLLAKMNSNYVSSYLDTKKVNTENSLKVNFEKVTNSINNNRSKNRVLSSCKIKHEQTSNSTIQEDKKSNNTTIKNNSNINLNKTKSFKLNPNKTASTFYNTKFDITYYNNDKNNIEELIDKFKSITLSKQTLFDYNSSLMSKLTFYRYQMDDFHFKEINLEGTKKNYEKKVKEIISNNYFNFEELTKYNEKCEKFMEENEYFIHKMKKKSKKEKMNKIIETINKDNMNDKENKKDDKDESNEDKQITQDDIVFKSSKNIIMSINNFFSTCVDSLKDIIVSINNIGGQNNGISDKKNVSSQIEEDNSIFMKENNISDENNDNPFIETFKKLAEYQKNNEIDISYDYKLLLQYINDLKKFADEDKNIQKHLNIFELKFFLLDKFYKVGDNPNNKKIDKLFVKRFLSKKTPNFNNIFNHLSKLLEPTMKNIKSICELINDDSSKKYLDNITQNKEVIQKMSSNNKKVSQAIINSENIFKNETMDRDIKEKSRLLNKYRRLSSSKSEIYKNDELCYDEEDTNSFDTQSTKKKVIKIRKKVKSIDEKVINKLYTPFLEKIVYLRKLNPNIPGIKQQTSSTSKTNFEIKKIINDVDSISHQMKVYNNPFLDPNKLSKTTYRSLVKLMVNDSNSNKSKMNVNTSKNENKFNK